MIRHRKRRESRTATGRFSPKPPEEQYFSRLFRRESEPLQVLLTIDYSNAEIAVLSYLEQKSEIHKDMLKKYGKPGESPEEVKKRFFDSYERLTALGDVVLPRHRRT